jgi:hypothetical protein
MVITENRNPGQMEREKSSGARKVSETAGAQKSWSQNENHAAQFHD